MVVSFDATAAECHSDEAIWQKPATESNRFSPEVARRLMEKLCSDDEFRALFLSDARAAMRQVGHETAPELVGVLGSDPIMCCINARQLASKESLRAARAVLEARLSTSVFAYDIVM